MSGVKCLKIHIGVKCHLASNVTCLLVVKCLWRQLSQPLTGVRGLASNVWATNVLGVKQPESVFKPRFMTFSEWEWGVGVTFDPVFNFFSLTYGYSIHHLSIWPQCVDTTISKNYGGHHCATTAMWQ